MNGLRSGGAFFLAIGSIWTRCLFLLLTSKIIPTRSHCCCATRGSKRIWIKQPGSGALSKRQATLVVCACPDRNLADQVKPGLIFRGTGTRISQEERNAWDPGVDVFF